MKVVEITKEPIELYKLLKLEGMAASGAEAKHVISEGRVFVNAKVETRKRKKMLSGDTLEFGEYKIRLQLVKDYLNNPL
ncbi:MAG: RNA-binding S4 domain-containing protein [Pseudomonadota bacterium]